LIEINGFSKVKSPAKPWPRSFKRTCTPGLARQSRFYFKHRKTLAARVLGLNQVEGPCPYQRPLLQICLLVFVVLTAGGSISANLSSAHSEGKAFFSVKSGAASVTIDISKINQVLHVAPTVSAQILTLLIIAVSHDTHQSFVESLINDAPGRAPPCVAHFA